MSEETKERGDIATRFQAGNKLWKARSRHGRKKIWDDPEKLLEACEDYFDWVEQNPWVEMKPMNDGGQIADIPVTKPRVTTIEGLGVYLGISRDTWISYRKDPDLSEVVKLVDQAMEEQKLSGAAAGLFKENLIVRYLGLADKKEAKNELTGANGAPIEIDHEYKVEFINSPADLEN